MPYPNLQNIAPHVWGPHAWRFLHAVALAYPESPSAEEKKAAFQFFSTLQYMLPCESCKNNFKKELQMFPLEPALESKQKLNEWLTAVHNSVSTRLKKNTMTPEQVLQYVFESAKHNGVDSTPTTTHSNTATPATSSGGSNGGGDNTWAIVATAIAGILLVAVVVLLVLHYKQKKVSRK